MWPTITNCILVLGFGLIIGSFLNAVIYRIPREISMIRPRSSCPSCGHVLRPIDLVPVFSYLCLKGHCRYCKSKVPLNYLTIEILTSILYLVIYISFGDSVLAVISWLLTAIIIAVIHIKKEKLLLAKEDG